MAIDEYFQLACDITLEGMRAGDGGPFGATLVGEDGRVICTVGNTVVCETDPTGHAEVVAIREACKKLETLDLSGCTMYATCEPCPMCIGAMMLAGIKTCYYASTDDDVSAGGFPVRGIRRYLAGDSVDGLELIHESEGRDDCAEIWREWQKN